MDRRITVRFYQLETEGSVGRDFAQALQFAFASQLNLRERNVGDGLVLRLETLTTPDGFLVGDFTRVQTENLPSHPTQHATDPLPIDRLGHHAAFCFDPLTQIIAVQFDMKMGMRRICSYATAWSGGKAFSGLPVLQQGALEHFEEETPVKFRVKVAKVNRFSDHVDNLTDFERGIEAMGALFDAPVVEIILGNRGRDGGLDKPAVLDTIRRFLGYREQFNGIKSITAESEETHDTFNFILQALKQTEVLDIPPNDPAVARLTREGFARRCMDEQLGYLRSVYGPANEGP